MRGPQHRNPEKNYSCLLIRTLDCEKAIERVHNPQTVLPEFYIPSPLIQHPLINRQRYGPNKVGISL